MFNFTTSSTTNAVEKEFRLTTAGTMTTAVEARFSDPKAVIFSETIVNLMGYQHLQAGDTKTQ